MAFVALSVVVVSNGDINKLKRVLESLKKQTLGVQKFEIVVADLSGSDEVASFIRSNIFLMNIQTVAARHPGLMPALNCGVENSEGDSVIFINEDMVLPASLLEAHYNAHHDLQHVMVRGPIVPWSEKTPPRLPNPLVFAPLYFELYNCSIPKIALAIAKCFDVEQSETTSMLQAFWGLRAAGYDDYFTSEAYCYQDSASYPEPDVSSIKTNAAKLAQAAVRLYSKNHDEKLKQVMGSTSKTHKVFLPSSNFMYGIARDRIDQADKISSKKLASAKERVFEYYFVRSLREELETRSLKL